MTRFFQVVEGGYYWQLDDEPGWIVDLEGEICKIRFAGKEAVIVDDEDLDWDYIDIESRYLDTSAQAQAVLFHMLRLNDILMLITDEGDNQNRREKLEELHSLVDKSCISRYKTWEDYFCHLDGVGGLYFEIVNEDILPDFNALKQGKFVYEGKLIAEI